MVFSSASPISSIPYFCVGFSPSQEQWLPVIVERVAFCRAMPLHVPDFARELSRHTLPAIRLPPPAGKASMAS